MATTKLVATTEIRHGNADGSLTTISEGSVVEGLPVEVVNQLKASGAVVDARNLVVEDTTDEMVSIDEYNALVDRHDVLAKENAELKAKADALTKENAALKKTTGK